MSRRWDDEERAWDREEADEYARCHRFGPRSREEAEAYRKMAMEAYDLAILAESIAADGIRRGLDRGAVISAVADLSGESPSARALAEASYDIVAAKFRKEFQERNPDVDMSPIYPRRPLDPDQPRPAPYPDDPDPEE